MNVVKFHPKDQQIMEILQRSGRVPVRKLAEEIGLSETAARYRLNKLLESGSVVVAAQIEPAFVGRPVNAFVRIGMDVGATSDAVAAIKGVDGVDFAALQRGTGTKGPVICAHATYPDHEDLLRVRNDLWTLPHVESVEVGLGLEIHSLRPRYWGTPEGNDSDDNWVRHPNPRLLEDIDLTILRELARDGRMSFTELAEHTGLSTAATRQRYVKLVEDGALRVRALPDPYRLGITGHGEIAIRMSGPTESLIKRAVSDPTTRFVVEVAGPYDLLLVQVCPERQDLDKFIEQEIATNPYVASWSLTLYDENIMAYTPPVPR
ncbi:Lrp/AsnC family transcriptional regulator [Paenarthrobacter sp. NPDC091711]|uniref:Lrp/AsnC family transcriptional regulator n=1 Tax=Paenarthrobacter sp. NPDC091711 TaxID=3364385 RepID=UPI00381AE3F0